MVRQGIVNVRKRSGFVSFDWRVLGAGFELPFSYAPNEGRLWVRYYCTKYQKIDCFKVSDKAFKAVLKACQARWPPMVEQVQPIEVEKPVIATLKGPISAEDREAEYQRKMELFRFRTGEY